MLASFHQERRDTTSKLISFNLCGYCYFIIPFEEEPEQAWISFSLRSTNDYFGQISKVVALCTSGIAA